MAKQRPIPPDLQRFILPEDGHPNELTLLRRAARISVEVTDRLPDTSPEKIPAHIDHLLLEQVAHRFRVRWAAFLGFALGSLGWTVLSLVTR